MALTLNGTTGISGIAGSAGTPALQGNNDTNTGYYFGTDILGLSTGGTSRLYIKSDGKVGIGTINPEEILHVSASSETVGSRDGVLFSSNSSAAVDTGLPLVFTSDIGGGFSTYGLGSIAGRKETSTVNGSDAAGYLQFSTTNTGGTLAEKLRITSAGKVGIGVTTPDAPLDIQGGIINTTIIARSTDVEAQIAFVDNTTTAAGSVAVGALGNDLFLVTGTGTKKLYIKSDGKVGIGTISPTTELEIFHATDPEIHLNINTHGDVGKILGDADGLTLTGNGSSNQIRFKTNDEHRMRINSSGNVGIGTLSPDALLHISGTNNAIIRLESTDTGLGQDELVGGIEFEKNDSSGAGAGIAGGIRCRSDDTYGARTYLAFSTRENSTGSAATDTEQFRILSQGGVTFNGDTGSAGSLNDWEEGSWTPGYSATSADTLSVSSNGKYTKIGRQVFAKFEMKTSNAANVSGEIKITGLPFTSANDSVYGQVYFSFVRDWSGDFGTNLRGEVNNNATTVTLYTQATNANESSSYVQGSDMVGGNAAENYMHGIAIYNV